MFKNQFELGLKQIRGSAGLGFGPEAGGPTGLGYGEGVC